MNDRGPAPLIDLMAVSRRFETSAETICALDRVSLRVERGEMVGLAGPSGSGKTSLIHLIMGWDEPDDGAVRLDASVLTGWSGRACVPQELGLLDELTARQNIDLAARLGGRPDRGGCSTSELLDELGLGGLGERQPFELSQGEQQRVAVARAVVCTPALIVADEATAHQDEAHADAIVEVLAGAVRRGGAVLLTTHDERVLARLDRVVRLLDGRLVSENV